MKIAFLTSLDATDKRSWSGTYYYMSRAVEKHIGEVIYLGPVDNLFYKVLNRILKGVRPLFSSKKYRYTHSMLLSWYFSKVFRKKLSNLDIDLIIAPAASVEIAMLKTDIPIVYLSDTTSKIMMDYYPEFTDLSKLSQYECNKLEQLAIRNSELTIYPSAWAANSAIQDMMASPDTTHVVPFGANIDASPSFDKVARRSRNSKTCSLLFLAREWERKGGPLAIATYKKLRERGLDVEFTFCGCEIPEDIRHIEGVTQIPFLDKNNQSEYKKFLGVLSKASFLFLPTRAECYGMVFCEASAYGIPSITTATGGVSGAVVNGVNGFALDERATAEEYAEIIYNNFTNQKNYSRLVQSTRKQYDKKLNWDAWALEFKEIVNTVM